MIDLYIKNGLDDQFNSLEILIKNGEILAVGKSFENKNAKQVIDLKSQYIISAGWIDDHTHCFEKLSLYYDKPDLVGYQTGVTTVIDAGSTGADNIGELYRKAKESQTNVYAQINISKTGILAQDELGDMDRIQFPALQSAVDQFTDFIVGVKARISDSVVVGNGIKPLVKAKKMQAELKQRLPLMVHVGSNPPSLSAILELLSKGDIMTHCFNGKPNGILTTTGQIKSFAQQGFERGIIFDIGHGTDSFNFKTAEIAKQNGISAETLSTDIYHSNRENGPVYDMATCMEKMEIVGYSLPEIIKMITVNPAHIFHLKKKGQLKPGFDADITIFKIKNKQKELVDSDGNKRLIKKTIEPEYAIIAGKVFSLKKG